jgi:SAM-dependent methyltransferase
VSAEYLRAYRAAAEETYRPDVDRAPWADPASISERSRERIDRHVRWSLAVLEAAGATAGPMVCDLSAGPGYHTFAYAQRFPLVLHCDLSIHALGFALARARREGVDNIVFVRADYLFSPFRGSLDCAVCFDTLIRGPLHEQALLAQARRALARGGVALVDFHNWWHNPVRRLGLMRDTFVGNTSYRRSEVAALLAHEGARHELVPFYAEDPPAFVRRMRALPCTRHGAVIRQ